MDQTIRIAGIPIPFHSPALLAVLAVHVAAGLGAVITGAVAMLSPKQPGRHPNFGRLYYRCIIVVTITMAVLSVVRLREDYHLLILGVLAAIAAKFGVSSIRRSPRHLRAHVVSLGASYILLLTAFYVDNGKNLPLWNRLPSISYWLLPSLVGVPLMIRALVKHPLLRRS